MKIVSRRELETLIQERETPCVSIYMPTFRKGKETEQNAIRFKNLLRQAADLLAERGVRSLEVERILKPGYALVENNEYWQHQLDGLAAFIDTEALRHYRLPVDFPEVVVVNRRFHIKPLLSLFSGDGRFYVLALSLKGARLFKGTRYTVDQVDLEKVPKGLADALKYSLPQRELQFHTGTPRHGGRRDAIRFGTGAGDRNVKDDALQYFRQVDEGLQELLRGERAPLLLAGVDYLLPVYREANKYPHLYEEIIKGNPDKLDVEELHKKAWELVEPHFRQTQEEAQKRFLELKGAGSNLATRKLREIVPASINGRVEYLFVPVGIQKWGWYDAESNRAVMHDEPVAGDQDLLDFASVNTIVKGGITFAVKPGEIPGGSLTAAVLRY